MSVKDRFCAFRIVLSAIVFLSVSSLIAFSIYTHLESYRDPSPSRYGITNPDQVIPRPPVLDEHTKDQSLSIPKPGQSSATTRQSCNPFVLPGYVDVKKEAWVPIYSQCGVITKKKAIGMLKHLRNKRYYFYGDSTGRYTVLDFCKMIGADMQVFSNPADYHITNEQPPIESCRIEALNFTAVSVFTFGLAEWSKEHIPFLTAHENHNFNGRKVNPQDWRIEDRMKTPNAALKEQFGTATMVFLSSGLWDLYHLQQYMTNPRNKITQSIDAPFTYLSHYASRWKVYIDIARSLHTNAAITIIDLADPARFEVAKNFGLEGYDYVAQHSCLSEARLKGFRQVTTAVVMDEKRLGKTDINVLPYDMYTRAVPSEKRMRDVVHPSEFVNNILSTALIWLSKLYDEI